MAPLVPAERLTRREAPVAHGAPVPAAARRRRGICRFVRRRRAYVQGQHRRRRPFPVASLVPAQRLVRRERLAADGAPVPELAGCWSGHGKRPNL
jgi:hypothetical protein